MSAANSLYIASEVPGPWAVDNSLASHWAIINTITGRRRVVGRVGRNRTTTNYFDRAMDLANSRNYEAAAKAGTK